MYCNVRIYVNILEGLGGGAIAGIAIAIAGIVVVIVIIIVIGIIIFFAHNMQFKVRTISMNYIYITYYYCF